MRVGLYARVSTERQHERGTIGSQLEALRAAADADGHEVIEEFIDNGYSGARLDRPALDHLRDAAEAGVLDGVLCLCVDRLARAYVYQVLILEELERLKVTVRFLEGPSPSDDPQTTPLIQMHKARLADWLAPRGLSFNEDKTRVVSLEEGFDFLGFNVRRYGPKSLIKPSKAAQRRIRERLRNELRSLRGTNAQAVIKRLNPIIRGWAADYRTQVSSEVFSELDHYLWRLTWQ